MYEGGGVQVAGAGSQIVRHGSPVNLDPKLTSGPSDLHLRATSSNTRALYKRVMNSSVKNKF